MKTFAHAFVVVSVVLLFPAGLLLAQVTDNRSTDHVFAQFADGRFPDGTSYRSTMMLASDSLSSITCTLNLYGLTVPGWGDGASFTTTIRPGRWYIRATPGTQSFASGYATVSCNGQVTAQLLYTFRNAQRQVISEATVFSSPPATIAQLMIDETGGSQLGIAIANHGDTAKDFILSVEDVGETRFRLGPRSQIARFLSQFLTIPSNWVGPVHIYTDTPDRNDVWAIGLRYTGAAFTTIPVTLRTPDSER